MGDAYIFTLQPTFTQGLILGQFSILCLLILVLKYLFFDSVSGESHAFSSYQPRAVPSADDMSGKFESDGRHVSHVGEADDLDGTDWLNIVLQEVLQAYRTKLRDHTPGPQGDEIVRQRVEAFANSLRPSTFLAPIHVHSVDLGISAPRLRNARRAATDGNSRESTLEFDVDYVDTVAVSFSTSMLFNYPFASFARLPVSLTISLSLFSAAVQLSPPDPHAEYPTLTITLPSPQTEFVLDLKTTSLMGSRAKLADVPKLHELITHQIRRVIMEKGCWKVVLPGLASVKEVKQDLHEEHNQQRAGSD
ncbi:maintenance of mitochondrial morphology protein 1 [Panus rudis PR-1116 ss-1]|nr:maintenance of mitochondrial morphology protein 1 [Panus rudis PR-1116 ss-1]